VTPVNFMRRECPECHVTLARYGWSQLWWLSTAMSGRLVHPCSGCGRLLRLSAMHTLTFVGALGLIASSIARFTTESGVMLAVALVCAVLILIGSVSTRVEVVRQIRDGRNETSAGGEPDQPASPAAPAGPYWTGTGTSPQQPADGASQTPVNPPPS